MVRLVIRAPHYEGLGMEQERFDELTRAVALGTNRRGLLAALSSAVVGAGLLAVPNDASAAKGTGKRKRDRTSKRKTRGQDQAA